MNRTTMDRLIKDVNAKKEDFKPNHYYVTNKIGQKIFVEDYLWCYCVNGESDD